MHATTPGAFAAVFGAYYAAHMVADHWIQTDRQARTKGLPGWPGRRACLAHVSTYTLTALLALVAVAAVTGVHLAAGNVAASLAVSAITHYIADRRTPLRKLAHLTGHGSFFALGSPRPDHDDAPCLGTGAYALDQSWHIGFLFVAALVAVAGVA